MNQLAKALFFLMLPLTFISCSKSSGETPDQDEAVIIGNWVQPSYNGDTIVYQRSDALLSNQYGISIQSGNKVIERKNSGWCGTPPIVCSDYEGTWKFSDSLLTIYGTFWGGKSIEKYKVVQITSKSIALQLISSEYPQLTK